MKNNWILISMAVLLLACAKTDHKVHDLLKHGVPFEIYGPDSITVAKQNFGILENFTIQGEGLSTELNVSNIESKDLANAVEEQKNLVKEDRYFNKIIEERQDGFLFERKLDSTSTIYDFRLIKLLGDKEYVFQAGIIEQYSLDKAKEVYDMMAGPKD